MFLKNKNKSLNHSGFTIVEVVVAVAIFVIFSFGVYEGVRYIYKVVYMSRIRILETALLSEELEVARNLAYSDVGIYGGVPTGLLIHSKTVVRDNISFDLITTVRNIDDPFDGMATGTTPKDTAPADYKLVEISAICSSCQQHTPVILNTIVAPKNTESDTKNGSLFINVFDSTGAPVQGAAVHVYNPSTTPPITVDDVTDSDGWLRVVDTPTGTVSYRITITKDGYSSDYTVTSSATVLNPIKPPATVTSQNVTEIYFSVDLLGAMSVHTINPNCSAAAGKGFDMWGEKRIGREPDVYKYFHSFTTDGGGDYFLPNIEWDKYWFDATGDTWDVGGTIPMLAANLAAGASQEVSLIVQPHTGYSLLMNIQDAGTKLPLSGANVRLFKTGYDRTIVTGLGYSRQTDWSGGSGQVTFTEDDSYFSDDGNLEFSSPAGDVKLKLIGSNYLNNGWLESSTNDLGSSVNFQNIIFEPLVQPPETGSAPVRFQIATSNSSTPDTWYFLGPDGTAGSYYTATNTIIGDVHDSQRYLRYRLFLSTDDNSYTPQLSEVAFTYTNSCVAPGQSYFNNLAADVYDYEITHSGYATATGTVSATNSPVFASLLASE